jgi:hypothetical protein
MYTLTPAYGRDYTSKKAAVADLNAGKDFVAQGPTGGGYAGARDLPDGTYTVRYGKLREVAMVTIRGGVAK